MKNKKNIKIFIGLFFSILVVAWLIFAVEWSEVLSHLAKARWQALLLPTLLLVIQFYLRIVRWHYLLPDYLGRKEDESKLKLLHAFNIGNFASYVLPLRAGEFLRPLVLSLKTKHSFPTSFVSVVIERFFDLSCVLIFLGIVALSVDSIPEEIVYAAYALTGLAFAILVFIIFAALIPSKLIKFTSFFISKLPDKFSLKVNSFLHDFLSGASVIKDIKNLLIIIFTTLLIWTVTALAYWAALWVLDVPKDIMLGMTITVFLALAVAAPSAPGFAGIYEAGCIAAFLVFGVGKEEATAYAIITHLHQYIIVIGLGVFSLVANGMSFSDLRKAVKKG